MDTSFARGGLLGDLLAGDDVDADVAGPPHQVVHDRSVQDLEPARPRGLADDDVRDVVLVGEANHVVGDTTCGRRDSDGLAAETLGKAHGIGDAVALVLGELRLRLVSTQSAVQGACRRSARRLA